MTVETHPADLLRALPAGSIPRPPVKPLYLSTLWLVTGLCLAMPLLYLAIIAGVVWLEYRWYTAWVYALQPDFLWGRAVAWGLPGFVGGILLLFLLKPFVAPRRTVQEEPELSPAEDPVFVEGVHALCRAIGTRPPSSIRLTHAVNAWVQFEPGLWGFLRGHRRLTIGMPLVAGLEARQFVGVLAHEFGHFAQGGGMRSSHVINRVNGWLWSRGYEWDAWDDRLYDWRSDIDNGAFAAAAWLASGCLWLTRMLMRGLFQISFRMSRRLSQEMEFDADRYEAVVAGSDCFAPTALRMRALMLAFQRADAQGAHVWQQGRLAADLSDAVMAVLQKFSTQDWDDLRLAFDADDTTHYWATHPADAARVANAEAFGATGLFLETRPARTLFADFPALSRRVTEAYYRGMGLSFGARNLVETAAVVDIDVLPEADALAWTRYTAGMLGEPARLEPDDAKRLPFSAMPWQQCVDELRRLMPDLAPLWARRQRQRQRQIEAAPRIALIDLGIDMPMPDGSEADAVALRTDFAGQGADNTPDARLLERLSGLFARRLQHAIDVMPEADRDDAMTRLATLQVLHAQAKRLQALHLDAMACLPLARGLHGDDPALRDWLLRTATRHRAGVDAVMTVLDALPLDDTGSMGRHLRAGCGHLADVDDGPLSYMRATAPLPELLDRLYRQELAKLVTRADLQEQLHGIQPIRLVNFAAVPPAAAPA